MKTPAPLLALLLVCGSAGAASSPVPWRHADPRVALPPLAAPPLRTVPNPTEIEREVRAREHLRKLRERPEDHPARKALATLRMEQGRDDEAARLWYEAARAHGDDSEALSGLAACMLRTGSLAAAESLLAEMRLRELGSPADRLNLAYAEYALGKFEAAQATLRAAVDRELAKADPSIGILEAAWFNQAVLAYSRERPDEAAQWLEKVRKGLPAP